MRVCLREPSRCAHDDCLDPGSAPRAWEFTTSTQQSNDAPSLDVSTRFCEVIWSYLAEEVGPIPRRLLEQTGLRTPLCGESLGGIRCQQITPVLSQWWCLSFHPGRIFAANPGSEFGQASCTISTK